MNHFTPEDKLPLYCKNLFLEKMKYLKLVQHSVPFPVVPITDVLFHKHLPEDFEIVEFLSHKIGASV